MSRVHLSRLLIVVFIIGIGGVLLIKPSKLTPETVTRFQAVQSLAPVADDTGLTGGFAQQQLDAVKSTPIDFATITPTLDNPDSMFNRWQRGEIDLGEENLLSAVEIAVLQETARRMLPGADVQTALLSPGHQAPSVESGFASLDYTEGGGSVPPDPELAVGPNHIIAVVNVAVEMYDKSGTTVFGPTSAGSLFTISPCTSGLYDPNVLYDEEADRWILAYDQGAFSASGGYCVLASQTGDPTGSWNQYFFNVNTAAAWMDYPHAGIGDDYLVMGGNMFTHAGSFSESRAWAWNKADLYAGNVVNTVEASLPNISTVQPLNVHGQSSGTWPSHGDDVYILGDLFNGSQYRIFRWTVPSNTLHTVGTVNLAGGGYPQSVPQGGGGSNISGNDFRALDFEYRNGYGWTTMTVACNPGSGTVNCVQWGQINLATATLGPAGTGVYGSNGEYRIFPDLAVNDCNDMAVGYTKSSASMFPSVWVTGRESGDAANTLQAEVQVKAGEIVYTAFDSAPRRWGDYTGMTIDPDGETFWYLGEYSKNTGTTNGRWGTWINSFSFAGCSVPKPDIAISPASLVSSQGTDSQTVQLLTISNNGDATLTWSIAEDNATTAVFQPTFPQIWSLNPNQQTAAQPVGKPVVLENGVLAQNPTASLATVSLQLDDGSSETSIGIGGGSFLWLNRFTPAASEFPFNLTQIQVAFGSGDGVDIGEQIVLYVYQDSDGDGNISNATLLGSYTASVAALSAFNTYTLSSPLSISGTGDILIGVYNTTAGTNAGEFPALLDTTASQQRSWFGAGGNPAILSSLGTLAIIDSFGFPGNWLVRGIGETTGPPPNVVCETPEAISWASVNPAGGSTASSDSTTVDVAFDTTGLAVGTYEATLCIDSNDPNTPQVQVPLSLEVTACVAPAAVTDVSIDDSGNDVVLQWTATGADEYEIHRAANDPYYTPSVGTLLATTNQASYTASNNLGDDSSNWTYIVIARNSCGAAATYSNVTGEFDFPIVPGLP